jgi:hypothetical protein
LTSCTARNNQPSKDDFTVRIRRRLSSVSEMNKVMISISLFMVCSAIGCCWIPTTQACFSKLDRLVNLENLLEISMKPELNEQDEDLILEFYYPVPTTGRMLYKQLRRLPFDASSFPYLQKHSRVSSI